MKEAWVTGSQLMKQYGDDPEIVDGIISTKTPWGVDKCYHPELQKTDLPDSKKMQYLCMVDASVATTKEDITEHGYNLQGEVDKNAAESIACWLNV